MFFWIREILGWCLVLAGIVLVGMALTFVEDRQVVEAGVVVMAATLIFRGGLLLIRISTAARICLPPTESEPNLSQRPEAKPASATAGTSS
ncbi:MAG: hypothetical protein KDA80_11120 [Planctomycetaceae bacterium]|nr:hypothetical protein [Planctomycetaceae bacterium]